MKDTQSISIEQVVTRSLEKEASSTLPNIPRAEMIDKQAKDPIISRAVTIYHGTYLHGSIHGTFSPHLDTFLLSSAHRLFSTTCISVYFQFDFLSCVLQQ